MRISGVFPSAPYLRRSPRGASNFRPDEGKHVAHVRHALHRRVLHFVVGHVDCERRQRSSGRLAVRHRDRQLHQMLVVLPAARAHHSAQAAQSVRITHFYCDRTFEFLLAGKVFAKNTVQMYLYILHIYGVYIHIHIYIYILHIYVCIYTPCIYIYIYGTLILFLLYFILTI